MRTLRVALALAAARASDVLDAPTFFFIGSSKCATSSIAAALAPTPQRPQYLSVVDGQGHSWSLFFAQPEQAHHFLQHVRPAKRGSNRVRHRS